MEQNFIKLEINNHKPYVENKRDNFNRVNKNSGFFLLDTIVYILKRN